MKIYTKTGDNGTTGLFAGPRVAKNHPRIEAYGAVDELNAVLGLVVCSFSDEASVKESFCLGSLTESIQHDLFSIGAQLATPDAEKHDMCLLPSSRIEEIELEMDKLDAALEPLTSFILPGGCVAAAQLHLARTV
ncbi:MAG: cob(I)yrinic acid a,c-diamide adenosyltransferase, partial [Planctomycetota bacterium]